LRGQQAKINLRKSKLKVTIQTKIEHKHEFLDETAKYLAKLRGKLLRALIKGGNLNNLKKEYIRKYGLMARQFNSLANEVKGVIKAVEKLQQRNIKNTKSRIKSLEKVIGKLAKQLKKKSKKNEILKKSALSKKQKFRFSIFQKKRKLFNLKSKLKRLKTNKNSICLGSKKLFRKQFNLKENNYESHQEWLKDFQAKRENRIYFIGSKDEKFGNQNCQLIGNILQIRVIRTLEEKLGKFVNIPIKLPYQQEIIYDAIKNEQAISYRFVRKEKNWYLFITTNRQNIEKKTKRCLGAIGVDLNKAHIAWSEINRHGNLIAFDKIHTLVHDRSSEQVTATLAEAAKELVLYAKKQEKPIVIENLDFENTKSLFEQKHSKYRRMLSSFAYSKFHNLLQSRAHREGVEIITVNPAFSSIIGKYKFSTQYGISVHFAASLVLARRGLAFSEKLPPKNASCLAEHRHQHVWIRWEFFVIAVANSEIQVERRSRHVALRNQMSSTCFQRRNSSAVTECSTVRHS